MMKSNSLTNRILALAMTLVMILGMLPSGIVSAETADTVTPPAAPEPEVTYVAEVNGTPYETLKDAIQAVSDEGCTLKMLTDTSIGYVGVMVYNDFVWDMNGKTLTVESEMTLGGDATITVTGNGTINNLRLLTNVIVENGTYAQITVPTGKNLLFKDGTVSGTMTVQGTATIAGGTVRGIIGTGSALITGGTVTNTFTLADLTGGVSITGGSFNRDVSEYVAEGYECVYENGSYVVRLKEKSYAAEVNGTKFETLEAALSAAQSGDTLTLLSDVTAAGPITIDKDITLNLNGFTLTLPEHNNYAIVVKDSLTINGEGNVIVEGLYGIGLSTTCTGGLTVNGGNITGANADYLIGAFNGKVTINGGNLTANYCVVNSFDGYNATAEIEGGTLTAEYPVLGTDIVVSDDTMLNVGGFLCRNGENYYCRCCLRQHHRPAG